MGTSFSAQVSMDALLPQHRVSRLNILLGQCNFCVRFFFTAVSAMTYVRLPGVVLVPMVCPTNHFLHWIRMFLNEMFLNELKGLQKELRVRTAPIF